MGRIIPVTDFDDPALDIYARLSENQLVCREKPEDGLFIAESALVIERALDAGFEPVSFLAETRLLPKAEAIFGQMSGGATGLYGRAPRSRAAHGVRPHARNALRNAKARSQACGRPFAKHVVRRDFRGRDEPHEPRGDFPLGGGARGRGCAADRKLHRSALSALPARQYGVRLFVPWAYLPDDQWQALLHENGFESVAMALREDAKVLRDPALRDIKRLAVVMGSEGPGLKASTIASCDYTVTVPMTNGVDSLNVAAASAVAFYQLALLRQHPL